MIDLSIESQSAVHVARHAPMHATICVQKLPVDDVCQLGASCVTVLWLVPFEMKADAANIGSIVGVGEDEAAEDEPTVDELLLHMPSVREPEEVGEEVRHAME